MGKILENWRIPAAAAFSVVLIAGAYLFARGIGSPPAAEASTEAALLHAIASKDSDKDGLPDWEEALYGTNPSVPDTFNLSMTDGEAVSRGLVVPEALADASVGTTTPAAGDKLDYAAYGLTPPVEGTLTDTFAKTFFALFLAAKEKSGTTSLSADQIQAVVDQSMSILNQSAAPVPDYRSAAALKISGSGPDALRAFAAAAEAVIKKNAVAATKSDLEYFQDAVENSDASAMEHLADLAKAYQASAAGLAVLPVPGELADIDAAIVNSIMRLGQIYSDFARVGSDPLTAIFAFEQYRSVEPAAEQAFTNLAAAYLAQGVVLERGEPGAAFVNLMADMTATHRAAQSP